MFYPSEFKLSYDIIIIILRTFQRVFYLLPIVNKLGNLISFHTTYYFVLIFQEYCSLSNIILCFTYIYSSMKLYWKPITYVLIKIIDYNGLTDLGTYIHSLSLPRYVLPIKKLHFNWKCENLTECPDYTRIFIKVLNKFIFYLFVKEWKLNEFQ